MLPRQRVKPIKTIIRQETSRGTERCEAQPWVRQINRASRNLGPICAAFHFCALLLLWFASLLWCFTGEGALFAGATGFVSWPVGAPCRSTSRKPMRRNELRRRPRHLCKRSRQQSIRSCRSCPSAEQLARSRSRLRDRPRGHQSAAFGGLGHHREVLRRSVATTLHALRQPVRLRLYRTRLRHPGLDNRQAARHPPIPLGVHLSRARGLSRSGNKDVFRHSLLAGELATEICGSRQGNQNAVAVPVAHEPCPGLLRPWLLAGAWAHDRKAGARPRLRVKLNKGIPAQGAQSAAMVHDSRGALSSLKPCT